MLCRTADSTVSKMRVSTFVQATHSEMKCAQGGKRDLLSMLVVVSYTVWHKKVIPLNLHLLFFANAAYEAA